VAGQGKPAVLRLGPRRLGTVLGHPLSSGLCLVARAAPGFGLWSRPLPSGQLFIAMKETKLHVALLPGEGAPG